VFIREYTSSLVTHKTVHARYTGSVAFLYGTSNGTYVNPGLSLRNWREEARALRRSADIKGYLAHCKPIDVSNGIQQHGPPSGKAWDNTGLIGCGIGCGGQGEPGDGWLLADKRAPKKWSAYKITRICRS
jgi:hypothetical protein